MGGTLVELSHSLGGFQPLPSHRLRFSESLSVDVLGAGVRPGKADFWTQSAVRERALFHSSMAEGEVAYSVILNSSSPSYSLSDVLESLLQDPFGIDPV